MNLSTWPLVDGASLVNLEQLTDSMEKLAIEIPPLVHENLEGTPETREELIDRRRDGNIIALHAVLVYFVNNSFCKYVKENNYKNIPKNTHMRK